MTLHQITRALRFWWQRRTRGWDDSETWNLDATIARFALPRLKRFRELQHGYWSNPELEDGSVDEKCCEHALAEIQWLLEVHASEDGTWQLTTQASRDRYDAAAELFGKNFGYLWS